MTFYLADEEFVSAWEHAQQGRYPVFPNVRLEDYQSLATVLFQSYGGRIPVMHMKDREEFEQLISAIFYKGEKRGIPKSMGAMAIKGWKDLFGKPHRAILLSDGYYSAVPPEEIGLEASEWIRKSFILRRTHECTHYYTLRAYGFMKNALKDELIADAMGIIEAFGEYRADLFLRFVGLENYPAYREGGRLQNYLPKDRPATAEEFKEMQDTACSAASALEVYLKKNPQFVRDDAGKLALLDKLAKRDDLREAL